MTDIEYVEFDPLKDEPLHGADEMAFATLRLKTQALNQRLTLVLTAGHTFDFMVNKHPWHIADKVVVRHPDGRDNVVKDRHGPNIVIQELP